MITNPKKTCLVLDLDDTLYKEYDYQTSGLKYIEEQVLELYDVEKLKVKHKIIISNYLDRVKTLNDYVKKENSTAVFINQVLPNGNELEKFFILNHSLIEYCKDVNMNCIDLASKLNGKFNYWYDTVHTTGLGSKVIAEIVIDDLVKIIKKEKLF